MSKLSPPIKKASWEELRKIYYQSQAGYYPLSRSQSFHGGIHLDTSKPICAVADGTVIAYRIEDKPLVKKIGKKEYPYSSSFVLLEHKYEPDGGKTFIWYSLYMHLLPRIIARSKKNGSPVSFFVSCTRLKDKLRLIYLILL